LKRMIFREVDRHHHINTLVYSLSGQKHVWKCLEPSISEFARYGIPVLVEISLFGEYCGTARKSWIPRSPRLYFHTWFAC
jgi:hypothetical protein